MDAKDKFRRNTLSKTVTKILHLHRNTPSILILNKVHTCILALIQCSMKNSQVSCILMYFNDVIVIFWISLLGPSMLSWKILYKGRNLTRYLIDKVIVYKFMLFKIWIFPKHQKQMLMNISNTSLEFNDKQMLMNINNTSLEFNDKQNVNWCL